MNSGDRWPHIRWFDGEFGTISAQAGFSHKVDMPNPELSEFRVRLPRPLKEQLQAVRGKNSLNREIVERLQLSLDRDPAFLLAEKLRPLLSDIEQQEQHRLVELATDIVQILRRRPRKGSR